MPPTNQPLAEQRRAQQPATATAQRSERSRGVGASTPRSAATTTTDSNVPLDAIQSPQLKVSAQCSRDTVGLFGLVDGDDDAQLADPTAALCSSPRSTPLSDVLHSVHQALDGRPTTDADTALAALLLARGVAPSRIVEQLCMELREESAVWHRLRDGAHSTHSLPQHESSPSHPSASAGARADRRGSSAYTSDTARFRATLAARSVAAPGGAPHASSSSISADLLSQLNLAAQSGRTRQHPADLQQPRGLGLATACS